MLRNKELLVKSILFVPSIPEVRLHPVPVPTGWGFASDLTVEIGKLAVETGMWYLAEYENGKVKMNVVPKNLKPVEDYLKKQRRFRHLTEENIHLIQEHRDSEWKLIREKWL
jgi:pyruvate ferredoxin oxidoreductase beta subunit